MSFEVRYNRDGEPIKDAASQPVVQASEQVPDLPEQAPQEESVLETQEAQPESDAQEVETEALPVEQVAKPAKPTPAESFKQLKESKEREERERIRAERERDALIAKIREMEAKSKPAQPEAPEEDYDININADDLVEGKHLNKVDKKIKQLEAKLKQYEQKSVAQDIDARIKSQYSDFDKVVTKANVEALRDSYPELYQTLNSSNDLYATAVSAYALIKKFGIVPEEDHTVNIQKVQANSAKPRPVVSVSPQQGDSPLSKANAFANGLTDELKEQLRKEMFSARNRI